MERRSRTSYSIMNIFASFVGYGLNLILSFVCRMIFVRCLSAEYLGISGLFSNILSMLSLAELGIGSAIVFALYKPIAENNEEKIASLMKFYGTAYKIIGFAVGIFGLCMLPFLNVIIKEAPNIQESLYLIYILYLFNTASSYFFSYRGTMLTANQRNYVVLSISYLIIIIQNALQIIVLLVTKNYLAYLLIQVACTFITNFLISWKAKKDYPFIVKKHPAPLEKEEKRSLIKNVKALTIVKLSGMIVNNTDNIVITYFNGLVTTGVASNYTLLSSMLNTIVTQVFTGITASVGNLNATESEERKYHFFRVLNLLNFWLYGWAAIGIVVVSSDLVSLFFGADYVLPIKIPLIMAVNFYMVGMQNAVWTYSGTMGLFRYGRYLLIATAALNIIGDIILGKYFGLFGIFAATAISRLLTNVWHSPYVVLKHGFKKSPFLYYKTYMGYAIILVATCAICWYLCSLCSFSFFINVIIKLLICTIVPNGVFWICFCKSEEFKYLYNMVKRILKKLLKR